MIEAFEKANPDIKITRTKVNFGGNFEKITTAVASGTAPDVTPIWSGFLTQFAASGSLIDLNKYGAADIKNSIYPASWNYVQYKDGVYGVPYAQDPRMIVYNLDAFKEVGLEKGPATLDELYTSAKALSKKSGNAVERYGLAVGDQDNIIYFFVSLLYANGGQVFNADETEVAFNSDAGMKAAGFLSKMAREGLVSTNVPQDNMRSGLLTGRFGMIFDGPWIFYAAANLGKPAQPFDVVPFPSATPGGPSGTVASVGAYTAFASSKHPEEAAKFVKFMASPEAQQYRIQVLKTGVSPAVVNEPYAKETFQKVPALAKAQEIAANVKIYPVQAKWTKVVDALRPALEAISSGADPQETINNAARQANRGLRR
ncbi:sugar ABC transporter substrate-binding protein (plasmid) [Microvirga lotononidis]|nr:sugar ABC transporter substrate-binding protein [Microvirga lotononidis]WQO31480.1 sugar ABC transporter substrate-binding protein [Microvirga lotononidis]